MKLGFILLAGIVLLFPCLTTAKAESNLPDSLFTRPYIRKNYMLDLPRAHELLDIAEKEKRMPQHEIDDLRSMIYNYQHSFSLAIETVRRALNSDSMKVRPEYELILRQRECAYLMAANRYGEAIQAATASLEKVKNTNNKRAEASFLSFLGEAYINLMQEKEGNDYFQRAIQLLEPSQNVRDMAELSTIYGNYMFHLISKSRYDEAAQTGLLRKALIDKMSALPGPPQGYIDQQYGYHYSKMAYLYQIIGKSAEAAASYRDFQKTRFASDPTYCIEGAEYLIAAKRNREALALCETYKQTFNEQDTISDSYSRYLEIASGATADMGNYAKALDFYKRKTIINDSLNTRYNQSKTLEMATIYETHEKDWQIKKKQTEIKVRNVQLGSVAGFALLVCLLLGLNYRHTRIIRRKNRVLADKVNRQLSIEDERFALRDQNRFLTTQLQILQAETGCPVTALVAGTEETNKPTDESAENRELFEELNQHLISKKLFLDPNLTRDDLIKLVKINKNRFAQIIKDNTDCNLKEYLNCLRTDYAIRQLKEHPGYTLEAIAAESGFISRGTFHSSFRKRTGMTPTEYKATLER